MDLTILYTCFFVLCFIRVLKEHFISCEIQSLVVLPTNSQVIEGQNTTLHCHVSNQVGLVQWSKDGLLLGFDPEIPGFPRYFIDNEGPGIYNLRIENVSLEDDADFECQVGPAEGQDLIVSKAHITVLLEPTSIEITDRSNGSEVQVKVSESVSLECIVKGGKPAPTITWLRNSFKLPDDQSSESTSDESGGWQNIKSTLTVTPNPDDNQANYACEASTEFSSKKLKTFVILNVLYPPEKPVIEGYRTNERIRGGESVNLRCISRGGNPLARLVWTKNGEYIDHSYTTSDYEAINEISLTAGASDDGATFTCSASNIMTSEPLKKSIKLHVLYAPESVSVNAPKEAKPGDTITVTCKTSRSNPASEITWVIDGRPVATESEVAADSKGGWITTSKVTVNVTEQDRNAKMFTCYAVNQDLGETITNSFIVSVLYAPDPPAIFGYIEGTAIHAGKLQRLTCISHGGNPLPELKWFKGEEELASSQISTTGTILSKELSIIAVAADHGTEYKCKSMSKALSEPLVASVILTVYFPPSLPTIKVKPKKPKAGSQIRLTCECSSSNPAANITWWSTKEKDEILGPPVNSISAASDNKGFITKSVLHINVTAETDGSKFICQATNEAIQESAHDAIVLSVNYKPVFKISDQSVFEVKENDSSIIDITAKGNPNNISYKWNKENETIWEGSIFNITSAERSLTGTYICTAKNEIGESSITILLKILYPMIIFKDTEEEKVVIAEPNSNVKLECTADGYPLPDNAITWKRDDFNMKERTETIGGLNGKSILLVKNVTKDISGAFKCEANNGVGSTDTWNIFILVKHEPLIKDLDSYKMILSDRKKSTELQCKAEGVPDVTFSWSFEGVIVSNKNSRIKHETAKVDHFIWKSVLTIDDVDVKDFGEYKCIARNEVGFDTAEINLVPDSAPDPPALVKITNITKNAIFIVWVPGFSGGHNQTHRVRFKSLSDPASTYIDVHPPATNSVWVQNLKPDMEYEVAMMSFNAKGSSSYTTDKIKVKTLGLSDGILESDDDDLLSFNGSLIEMLVGSLGTVFLLLLVFNIVLLALYYQKKKPRAKSKRKYSEDYTSSSSDISISTKVESEETTFSSFSSEPKDSEDRFSYYSSHSLSSKAKSESYLSSYESGSEEYSESYSSNTFSKPYSSSKFI